jgi:hypothetical protein
VSGTLLLFQRSSFAEARTEDRNMRLVIAVAGLGLAIANPLAAQTPNVQQLLQGLTTGNQNQDQALRDAFERGYRRGRQDEAQMRHSDRKGSDRSNRQVPADESTSDYRNNDAGGRNQPYGDQDRGSYRP